MDKAFFSEHQISRRADESDKAFSAFCAYLSVPVESRSLRKLEAEGFAVGSLMKWSSRHEWQSRAVDFDNMLVERELTDLIQRRRSLVIKTIEASISDHGIIRKKLMDSLLRVGASEIPSLVSARRELDGWMSEILGVLEAVADRDDSP